MLFIAGWRALLVNSGYDLNMDSSSVVRRNITSRVIRKGDFQSEELEWENSTLEERMNAVWELTRLCLAWQTDQNDEPRLQRSISRVQRPRS